MKKACLITLILLCFSTFMPAQAVFRGEPARIARPEAFSRHLSEYHLFQVDAPALSRYAKTASGVIELELQLGGLYRWPVALYAHDIRAEGYQLIASTPAGPERQARSENKTFKGKLLSPQGGAVRLTLDEHFIYGFVEAGAETYYIEPAWHYDRSLPEDTYLAYRASAVLINEPLGCGWEEEAMPRIHEMPAPEAGRFVLACYNVQLALAADFAMVQRFGSVNNVESFMLGVLNNVQTNFDDEFTHNIIFVVPTMFVSACSTCDPWGSTMQIGTYLDNFTAWGNSGGFGAVSFDVASLWSGRSFSGDAIGVAFVGGLCSTGRYNVLENFSTNAALLRVLQAHELGHNFNVGHDGASTNFIMTPSVTTSNAWSNVSRIGINAFVNSQISTPGCLSACGSGGSTPPSPALVASTISGCTPLVVEFADISTGQVDNVSWQFPGGTPSSSSNTFPTVTYNAAGTYDVILTVSNSGGANTLVMEDYITVSDAPAPQFSFTTDGLTVYFNNTSANADSFLWDFADGNFSTSPSPVHTYPTDGLYIVTLTAANDCGPVSTEEYVVVELPMQAGFSASSLQGCAGMNVSFSDLTTGNPTAWNWSFPGGVPATSAAPNPSVAYPTAGVYPVTLTVTNVLGTTSTQTRQNYVSVLPNAVAAFTPQYGIGSLAVQFENNSSGADSWSWDFGDGNGSNSESPVHAYATDGTYTVALTVSGPCGTNSTSQDITIITPPSAAYSANVLSGCAPVTVQFANQSSSNADAYQWHFEGGSPQTSSQANPVVAFNAPGTYTATLIVSNAAGRDTSTQEITLEGGPRSAFAVSYSPGTTTASFSNQSSNADSLHWYFGDGTASTNANPSHDFGSDGIYTISLITVNDCGSDTLSQQLAVVTPPLAGIGVAATAGCAPFSMQINDQSSGNTTSWLWSAPGATPNTSNAQNPSFTFDTPGTYTISLEAGNAAGTSRDSISLAVGDIPQAQFSVASTLGQTAVSLSNSSADADSFAWDFGDGNTSSETQPAHSYAEDGTYTITLVATNECGSDTATRQISITTPPTAAFELGATAGCAPFTVQVSDLSSSNATSWAWSAPGAVPGISNEPNPSFTFAAAGAYTITLEAGNAAGTSRDSISLSVGGIPQAQFSVAAALGQTAVSLSNSSSDADSFAWDFGDGNTSSETQPAHSYAEDGIYTITLTATNGCGSDTATQQVSITTPPTAAFELGATAGCAPFTVQANNLSSSNATSWAWSAPGAVPGISNEPNPSFTFAAAGAYTISLEAGNAAGTSRDSISLAVGDIPQAQFSVAAALGQTAVSLSNSSADAGSFAWFFGDGATSNETEPAHSYAEDGTYIITLVATNNCGSDTATQQVTITTPPTAAFELGATAGCAPFTVQATNLSSSNATSWAWSAPGAMPGISNEPNPSFTFAAAGTYTISLEAGNAAGSSLVAIEVAVNGGPEPGFFFQANGMEVQFFNTSGNSIGYEWDFGDGGASQEAGPLHSYAGPGDYEVSLLAANECGEATITQTVTIDLAAPVAGFTFANGQGCAPLTVTFEDSSQGADSYAWTFPGGTPATSTEQNPTVTYQTPGIYSVTLVAGNAAGSGALTRQDIVQAGGPPEGSFAYAADEATVAFANATQNADSYLWLFGDGNSSTEENPEHTYSLGGDYIVMLLAANDCGTDTVEQTISLSGAPPLPNLSASTASGCAPLAVAFDGGAEGTVSGWSWSFPGGTPDSSTEPNPTVLYEQAGTYDVSLTVSNAFGSNSQEASGLISVNGPPEAAFTYELQGLSASFANTSAGAGLSYSWSFGDGAGSSEENPQHTYASAGEYKVILVASNECGETAVEETIVVVATGAADESWLEELSLFPNPTRGAITLRLQGRPADELRLSLMNAVGQRLFHLTGSFHTGYWQQGLDLQQLPAGVYVLEVMAGGRRAYRRVVVE